MDIRADSLEYATATITATHDLTGDTVEVALPLTGVDPVTWLAADVVSVTDLGNGTWRLTYRLLLGPGGDITLTQGSTYDWLVRVTDSPEIPVRLAGSVNAT
jgi:hypothetical protein